MFETLEKASAGHTVALNTFLDALPYNADGLLPAIVQDSNSKDVLMMAWMDREAIERTLADGFATFFSRSRQAYWRKGETSGNLQKLVGLQFDCDGDAILLTVNPHGPACHTNRANCFYLEVQGDTVRVISSRP